MMDNNCDINYCNTCEMEHFQLVEQLIMNIRHLESKVVYLRCTLSNQLPQHEAELLRSDIFSDLSLSYFDNPAFLRYMTKYCDGIDPMDDANHCKHLKNIAKGKTVVNL